MFEYIKKELEQNANNTYKEFNSKLCPDTKRKVLGVKIPVLRKMAQDIVKKEEWVEFLRENKKEHEYLEEVTLEGLVIAYVKVDIEEKLKLLENFVPKIDSWSTNDTVCPTIKPKYKELDKVWKFIRKYVNSDKEFEIRFGVIMLLDYFIIDEYIDEVITILDSIKTDKYYAQMAIAWTMAEIGIKYNDKAMKYLKNANNLDDFTYNKTLQKMIESYRISKEQKEELKNMKK